MPVRKRRSRAKGEPPQPVGQNEHAVENLLRHEPLAQLAGLCVQFIFAQALAIVPPVPLAQFIINAIFCRRRLIFSSSPAALALDAAVSSSSSSSSWPRVMDASSSI